jgi:N-acetylglucosamine-6-sulfatase
MTSTIPGFSRRSLRRGPGLVLLAAAAAVYAAIAAGPMPPVRAQTPQPVPTRPNIVLVLVDDLSVPVLEAAANVTLGDGRWFMPNFRQYILEKAVEFRQAFSPNPLCCPARASLLTGQYSHNHGALSNAARNGGVLQLRDGSDRNNDGAPDGDTLPLALQRAGYRTAHVGKYLNGYGVLVSAERGADREKGYQAAVATYGEAADTMLPAVPATGRAYEPPGWTEWYGTLDVTSYCNYNTVFSVDGRPTLFHSSGALLDPDALPPTLPPPGGANYQTDVIRDLSLRFLARHGPSAAPLFLSISPLVPHVEACDWSYARLNDAGPMAPDGPYPFLGNLEPVDRGGQGYAASFLDTVRPGISDAMHIKSFWQVAAAYFDGFPSFDETDLGDKPVFLRSKLTPMHAPYVDGPAGTNADRYPYLLDAALFPVLPAALNRNLSTTTPYEQVVDQFARMMASLGAVDRMIGAVAQRLEDQGRLANTVFVFMSDNGYSHGQHRLSGKLLAYEESIRVPLFVSLPGLSGGPVRSWGMVLHTDIAPTLLDLASSAGQPARLTHVPDGTSLKTLLHYPTLAWRRQALVEHFDVMFPGDRFGVSQHPSLFGVRTSHHNSVAPSRLYAEYFGGIQYAPATGPNGWPGGFYRGSCPPDGEPHHCTAGNYKVPVRPYIYTPGFNPDRLADREYYNLPLDPFQLTNGFGAGAPSAISSAAIAEASTLRCRLNALVGCAGRACQAAEWAAEC